MTQRVSTMLSRRGGPAILDVDRETFEKTQTISIQKAINQQEVPAKEKHVRNAILGTYQEKGAYIFWHVVRRLQLSTHAITCWKFCHVLHKLLRDGHDNTLRCSVKYKQQVRDLGKIWAHALQAYGSIIAKYATCLVQRMEFQVKYSEFPGNLLISDEALDKLGNSDINAYFELCVDILDCLDSLMNLQQGIFKTLDFSKAISMTGPGQCRLAPCIPIILDSSQMYDYAVKLLFKLHACLPADTLSGHRERFLGVYGQLKKFYYTCSNMQYFKRLIQVPLMPDSPPDFLLKLNTTHQLGPVKMLSDPPVEIDRTPSPEPEPAPAPLIETNFDEVFGSDAMGDFSFQQEPDPRDEIIRQLKEEIEMLKAKINSMQHEHHEEIRKLLDRISELNDELMKREERSRADAERVRELETRLVHAEGQAESAAKKQGLLVDAEKKAAANEELYKKMKDKHMGLVKDHALLLRKNADTQKQSETLQHSADDLAHRKSEMLDEMERLRKSLTEKEDYAEQFEKKRRQDAHMLFISAVEAAETIICETIAALDDPVNAQSTCSAESLIKTVECAVNSLQSLENGAGEFMENQTESKAIQALSAFGHNMSQTLLNGIATCHLVSEDHGEGLDSSCRSCGNEALSYLAKLKNYEMYGDKTEVVSGDEVRDRLQKILSTAKDLLPKMTDVLGGDLQDMVEQEMASTSTAIEDAARRIEEMLREARERDSGVNLEVNERILDSCTELMQAIRALIISSKDLQREIVDEGRGASSVKEFYMKNSRWTEGLISAAKAVGWGATLLTDTADQVITADGKFEEIIVCSHEIAASTAQLVAASRVKAKKASQRLPKLQKASKDVNVATARVVASTNSGRQQIDESSDDVEDLSKITLTQIKRKEMDSQVHILELEQALQQERIKIGKLRKQHYIMAAENEKDEEEEAESANHNGNSNNNNNNVKTISANGNNGSAANRAAAAPQKPKPPLPQKPTALKNS